MRRLSYRQVLELVSGKPVDELILVGGQATNAWAEALGIASESAEGLYGAALSDDIDYPSKAGKLATDPDGGQPHYVGLRGGATGRRAGARGLERRT